MTSMLRGIKTPCEVQKSKSNSSVAELAYTGNTRECVWVTIICW